MLSGMWVRPLAHNKQATASRHKKTFTDAEGGKIMDKGKRLNHTIVRDKINKQFNLTSYKQGKYTHFVKDGAEIGYIEQIGATKNYLTTILCNFFCFEDVDINDKILIEVEKMYKEQRGRSGINYALELRGVNICKSVLI